MNLLKVSGVLHSCLRFACRPRTLRPYLRDLYFRRLAQGPEPYRPRSAFLEWNLDSELSAFQHRIGENITSSKLLCALTDKSYIVATTNQHTDHKQTDFLVCNAELTESGLHIAQSYMLAFLRGTYPCVPEEWISSIVEYLLSPPQLSFVAASIGLKDLVLYSSDKESSKDPIPLEPPSLEILSNALLAIVGALAEKEVDRATLFVRDFILVQLPDLDVLGELIVIEEPLRLLSGVLVAHNRPLPEPRLQSQCGMNTLLACYQVGIYCNKELLGEGPGETMQLAIDEAARQSLRNLLGLSDHCPPLQFTGSPRNFGPDTEKNVSLQSYLQLAPVNRPADHV